MEKYLDGGDLKHTIKDEVKKSDGVTFVEYFRGNTCQKDSSTGR